MKMPEKSTDLWAAALVWLHSIAPSLYAPGLSAFIAVLRVIYGGGSRRQMAIEGALCGSVTLALKPVLLWAGMPGDLSVFLGAYAGFVGVEKLRDWAIRLGERKTEGR